ncbi:MAG: FAD-dependent monooxygenase [Thiomicrorhabdus sp.]|nr:FAD-dependent monooxygenase [Thiomicrorhabdus sp.]
MQQSIKSDVVIAGGGPVGLMLALGLAQQEKQVVLAEAFLPAENAPNSFDGRVLALSHGSMLVLESLGLWHDLIPFVTDIYHVHVSQKGYLGITTLHADEVGVPALGYSIQSSDLGRVLWQHVKQHASIQVFCPARVVDFQMQSDKVQVQISVDATSDTENTVMDVEAKLIVGADGTNSQVRKILQLPLEEKSYHAFGVLAQIETEEHPNNWSFERFTEEGPVALLPMKGHAHKAVLVCSDTDVERIKGLSDEDFMALFASKMGERLGAFTKVSPRIAYPLKETYVAQMAKGRALLMGNASHTQHPVAAQGLNLGIQDIEVFLNHIERLMKKTSSKEAAVDFGEPEFLADYANVRKPAHDKVMGLTDGLIQIFQHHSPIVGHLRGLGLMAMQAMPTVKRRFARFAMGGQK